MCDDEEDTTTTRGSHPSKQHNRPAGALLHSCPTNDQSSLGGGIAKTLANQSTDLKVTTTQFAGESGIGSVQVECPPQTCGTAANDEDSFHSASLTSTLSSALEFVF